MPINIKSAGGGGVVLSPASTGTDINVTIPATSGTLATREYISASNGASLTGYMPSGTGAVASTIQAKLRERVSVKDFGAVGDGVTDDAVAIQAAITASVGKSVYFPSGTYIVGTTLNLPSNSYLFGDLCSATLKLKSQAWGSSSGLLFSINSVNDVSIFSLTLDGNKGNVGTTRSPLNVVYIAKRVSFENVIFKNSEGICINASTDIDDITILQCEFLSCGGDPSNSDGYRKQALAFSSSGATRSQNITVKGCYFYRQGLDSVSLSDCDNIVITDNESFECYTFVYNTPSPRYSTNLVVGNNVVRTCSEFGAATAVPPCAVDLPNVKGLTVSGNAFYDVDAAAIGIFSGTTNATVTSNTIVNPMRGGINFNSGIIVGDTTSNINIQSNTILDALVTPIMLYGIVVRSDATGVLIKDNIVINPLTSRYGYYSTNPFVASTFAFTSNTQVSASTRIIDLDISNNLEVVNGRLNLSYTDNTNPVLKLTQLGTGPCILIEDQASDSTYFSVDSSGNVGIAISPAVFGCPFTVSGSGTSNYSVLHAYGANSNGVSLKGVKSRNTSPYSHTIVNNSDLLLSLDGQGSDGVSYQTGATVRFRVDSTPSVGSMPTSVTIATTPSGSVTPVDRLVISSSGDIRSVSNTGAIGYGTGSGGAVVQATSKSTAVTLSTPSGRVTTSNAALAANTTVTIPMTNTLVTSTDNVVVNISGGIADASLYNVWAYVGTGSINIYLRNISGGTLSEAVVINYSIIRGAFA